MPVVCAVAFHDGRTQISHHIGSLSSSLSTASGHRMQNANDSLEVLAAFGAPSPSTMWTLPYLDVGSLQGILGNCQRKSKSSVEIAEYYKLAPFLWVPAFRFDLVRRSESLPSLPWVEEAKSRSASECGYFRFFHVRILLASPLFFRLKPSRGLGRCASTAMGDDKWLPRSLTLESFGRRERSGSLQSLL